MAKVDFTYEVPRNVNVVRRLLVHEGLINAFVDLQHADQRDIRIDHIAGVTSCRWVSQMPSDTPAIVKQLVGKSVEITLVMDLTAERLRLTAVAKRSGQADCQLIIAPSGDEDGRTAMDACTFTLKGDLKVDGFGGSFAETTARDEILRPVIGEELVPLLSSWAEQ